MCFHINDVTDNNHWSLTVCCVAIQLHRVDTTHTNTYIVHMQATYTHVSTETMVHNTNTTAQAGVIGIHK